jgi:hypothetical protein
MSDKKCLVVYEEVPERTRWFVADASFKRFCGVFINSGANQQLEDELSDAVYDSEGQEKVEMTLMSDQPINLSELDVDCIVHCGFWL